MVASCPSLRCSCRKDPVWCREAKGLVTELCFPRFVTMQWLCSQLCYVTAANQSTIVEIELLATVGWKWGCQPFSCRCSQNVTHCKRRFVGHVSVQESIPAIDFGYSKHPLPSLQLQKKPVLCAETEGLFCHGVMASRFVTMQWLCSQLCYVTAANHWTIVEIELLATVGWKWGCRPFSCRCSQNVTDWQKEICSTSLSKESIPTIPFGNLNHPVPARSRFLRAAVSSTCFALWLHPAHPFVADAGNNLSDAEKQSVWSRSCGSQDLLQCSDCALSRAIWLLQTNEQLSRLSF